MDERLRQAVYRLALPRRFDRSRERVSVAACCRPVRGELRRGSGPAVRELVCKPRVQVLALPGQDRRVDGLREKRVTESEAVRRLLGDEDSVLDCLAQRLAHIGFGKCCDGGEESILGVASDGRRHLQKALCASVEFGHALQQQSAQASRKLAVLAARGFEKLCCEEGVAFGAGEDGIS